MLSVETVVNERNKPYANPSLDSISRAMRFVRSMVGSINDDRRMGHLINNRIGLCPVRYSISQIPQVSTNTVDNHIVTGLSYLHIVGRAHTASVRLRA